MIEHAFHYWDRAFSGWDLKSEADWLRDIEWLADDSTANRLSITFTGVNTTNMTAAEREQAERYEYASFLIGQNANSTAIMTWSMNTFNDPTYNALNDVDLGAPTGSYVQDWQGIDGIYERPYEQGIVLVHAIRPNNGGVTKTVNLTETYRTLDNQLVTGNFNLAPNTGHILTWVDVDAPTVPANLAATANSATAVTLNWSSATDNVAVTGYHVYRNSSLIATVTGATTYQDSGLAASTGYNYKVSAFDAADNESAQSTAAVVTTNQAPDASAPGAVADLEATAS